MFRTKCGSCGTGDLNLFLDLGKTPLADRFPATRDEVEEEFPLRAGMCERCKLVQLMDIVPDEVLYSHDYAYYTGAASSHNSYWDQYAREVLHRFGDGKNLLEIACNDGSLLSRFDRHGFNCVGVDPATGPLSKLPVHITRYPVAFDRDSADDLMRGHQQFDIVVANNVLAHVSDLDSFVQGLSRVTHRDSVIIVEVQYLGDLVTGNQFDHFYHEHRSFFSLRSLNRVLVGRGFRIFDVQRTSAQGGSIRVFISKGSFKYPTTDRALAMLAGEAWLDEWFTMESMAGRVDYIRDSLLETVQDLIKFPSVVAGYGATAKSCTLLNYCGINDLQWVVDTTPWKQGRFTPGTKIPVLAPKDEPVRPDYYLLLAWNYLPAILRKEREYLRDYGEFIVPLPKPVIL